MKDRFKILCLMLVLFSVPLFVLAEDQPYTNDVSFIGGAGATATNAEYELVSSWRQPTQTSVSSGGAYDHASGFLAAVTDVPTAFRILSFSAATNPIPSFQITIPTKPGLSYVIQFHDGALMTQPWQNFANTNQSIGAYFETNSTPDRFTFIDDFTPATSGSPTASTTRFYRVMINNPAPAP